MKKILLLVFILIALDCFGQVPFFINQIPDTNTVLIIGDQIWMKYNLDVTQLNDGTPIANVTDAGTWAGLTSAAYCWYDNDYDTYGSVYGAFYNWYAVETGKLCPIGWHVPDSLEWAELIDYVGDASDAGGKLKEVGTTHWSSPNVGATDEYGFRALPTGIRQYDDGAFEFIGNYGYWWTDEEINSTNAYGTAIFYNFANIFWNNGSKKGGKAVRCIKN